MISRKPSKIIDSVVNSAHEDHFTVAKAIKTDAPITDLNSVVNSVNFETDSDGAYTLRKPLVLKSHFDSLSKILLSNKKDILTIGDDSSVTISNASKIILKYYDIDNNKIEVEFSNAKFYIAWMTILKNFNTSDNTVLSAKIDVQCFNTNFDSPFTKEQLTFVYRFIKIYPHESQENIYVFEIVHPETNTFTTGLDVGNVSALDINLLLDNPYAIRDLYNYGANSITKILPYISIENLPSSSINEKSIWELTEKTSTTTTGFKILNTINLNTFDKNFIVLKAFLTTTISAAYYYCCWEYSKDDGITWEVAPEFIRKFNDKIETIKVTDLTSKEFEEKLTDESLEKATSYVVDKKVLEFEADYYNNDDKIKDRPDVLIIGTPNASYKYRFSIYLRTNKEPPKVLEHNKIVFKEGFGSGDDIQLEGKVQMTDAENSPIEYKVFKNDSLHEPTVENTYLTLYEADPKGYGMGAGEEDETCYYGIGNSLRISCKEDNITITKIQIHLAPKQETISTENGTNVTTYSDIGACIGSTLSTYIGEPPHGNDILHIVNRYSMNSIQRIEYTFDEDVDVFTDWYALKYDPTNLWRNASEFITFNKAVISSNEVDIVNLTTCLTHKVFELEVSEEDDTAASFIWFKVPETWDKDIPPYIDMVVRNSNEESYGGDARIGYFEDPVYGTLVKFYKPDGTYWPEIRFFQGDISDPVNQTSYIPHPDATEYPNKTLFNGTSWEFYGTPTSTIKQTTNYDFLESMIPSRYLQGVEKEDYLSKCRLKISRISVSYTETETIEYADAYLVSTSGVFNISFKDKTETVEDLTNDRERLFNGTMFYNDKQAQLLVYKDNYVYVSGTNSSIFRLMNSLTLSETINKIIKWRGYLVLFTNTAIYLATYNPEIDSYDVKTLSSNIGVRKEDAETIIPILNSIYFKSGTKIYKLVPNLYAASDDILNIHVISSNVNDILEKIVENTTETSNFSFADSDCYMVFIPTTERTYCIKYTISNNIWNLFEYPISFTGIVKISNTEVYIQDISKIYYFTESLNTLIAQGYKDYSKTEIPLKNLTEYQHTLPYADYLTYTPRGIISYLEHYPGGIDFNDLKTDIYFELDFGQKSSNYTMDKQFLETKITLATKSSKDSFPFNLDISTDGVTRELHWDSNTDGALWKKSVNTLGVLNHTFTPRNSDYDGILRQLIVKYSGKGKIIRHVISGYSNTLFKILSLDVRARVLPKKH